LTRRWNFASEISCGIEANDPDRLSVDRNVFMGQFLNLALHHMDFFFKNQTFRYNKLLFDDWDDERGTDPSNWGYGLNNSVLGDSAYVRQLTYGTNVNLLDIPYYPFFKLN